MDVRLISWYTFFHRFSLTVNLGLSAMANLCAPVVSSAPVQQDECSAVGSAIVNACSVVTCRTRVLIIHLLYSRCPLQFPILGLYLVSEVGPCALLS